MFTAIIQAVATVSSVQDHDAIRTFVIEFADTLPWPLNRH